MDQTAGKRSATVSVPMLDPVALTTFVFGRHGGRSSRRRTSNGARRHSCRGDRRHRLERPPASRTASASSTARVRRACRCRRIQRAPTISDNNDKTNPRPVFVVAPIQVEASRSSTARRCTDHGRVRQARRSVVASSDHRESQMPASIQRWPAHSTHESKAGERDRLPNSEYRLSLHDRPTIRG